MSQSAQMQSSQPDCEDANEKVDILFIDKYIDPAKSLELLNILQAKFQFNEAKKRQLSSGIPVVIKHQSDLTSAKKLVDYITKLGGDCWLQTASDDSYNDRRDKNRRHTIDRRLLHRGWAIMPDRRHARERRVFFH